MVKTAEDIMTADQLSRAQGCLLGQLAGDSLGSLVEFQTPEQIRRAYPRGVRELADGGTWDTIAGQPTDDSEMALSLTRTLLERGTFDVEAVRKAYCDWLDSGPFDCGDTVAAGLFGNPNPESQANGAMMRVSPLGIFGAKITHPNQVCVHANMLFCRAIASAIREGPSAMQLYDAMVKWARDLNVDPDLLGAIEGARTRRPPDYVRQQGWVLIAFGNALWQLIHAESLEEGVVDTVMQGGDTDTNAAICGALLGAVHGRPAVPQQWVECLLNCRPDERAPNPRPVRFWPVDCLELAERLLQIQETEPFGNSRR